MIGLMPEARERDDPSKQVMGSVVARVRELNEISHDTWQDEWLARIDFGRSLAPWFRIFRSGVAAVVFSKALRGHCSLLSGVDGPGALWRRLQFARTLT